MSPSPISSVPVLRLTGLAAVTLAAAACGSSSAQSTPSTQTTGAATPAAVLACGPSDARTYVSDAQARVYAKAGTAYGCAKGHPAHYVLGQTTSCLRTALAGPFALAGVRVAYAVKRCGVDTGRSMVTVRSLADGHAIATYPATTSHLGVESYTSVSDIVLGANGAVGWITQAGSIVSQRRTVEVHVADAHGTRTVDTGSAIGVRSLRVTGATLHWTDGGRAHSAPLA